MSRLSKIEAAVKFYRAAEARAGKARANVAFMAEDKREIVRLMEVACIRPGAFAGALGVSYTRNSKEYNKIATRLHNFISQVEREREGGSSVVSVSAVRQPIAAPVVRHVKTVTLDGKLGEIKAARRKLEEKIDEISAAIFEYEEQEKVLEAAVQLLK